MPQHSDAPEIRFFARDEAEFRKLEFRKLMEKQIYALDVLGIPYRFMDVGHRDEMPEARVNGYMVAGLSDIGAYLDNTVRVYADGLRAVLRG